MVEFYYGTVQLSSSLNKKAGVKWGIDETFIHVNVEDLKYWTRTHQSKVQNPVTLIIMLRQTFHKMK